MHSPVDSVFIHLIIPELVKFSLHPLLAYFPDEKVSVSDPRKQIRISQTKIKSEYKKIMANRTAFRLAIKEENR